MEETKLDKFVGKIFNQVEKATSFLQNEHSKSRFFYKMQIFQLLLGILMTYLHFFVVSDTPKTPLFIKVITHLQGPIMILTSIGFLYSRLRNITDIDLKILKFSRKIYSEETNKLCFEPLLADWKTEFSQSISQNRRRQANWITLRYVFAFLSAMFQQSKIGRLFEFIFKR